MARYPYPIPFGWFQICWPDDLVDGQVLATHNVGRDLEVHRHGDQFQVVDTEAGRKLPTEVRNGLVLFWWHPTDQPPAFSVPELGEFNSDPAFTAPIRRHYPMIRAFWQELAETAADVAHIQQHLAEFGMNGASGRREPPAVVATNWKEPHGWMRLSQPFPTPRGDVAGNIDIDCYGPGVSVTWFKGLIDTGVLGCNIPVDEDTTEIRFTYVVRTGGSSDPGMQKLAEAFVAQVDRLAVDDLTIWENKAYIPRPALADTDGPIMPFRRWAEQFYRSPSAA